MTRIHIKIGQDKPVVVTCRSRVEATQRALDLVRCFRENGRPVRGSARRGQWSIDGFFDPIIIAIRRA